MNAPSPYKGLMSYDRQDQDSFFGRAPEKHILLSQILTHRHTLLYAASGVGKSSLLGAVVIPELEDATKENLDVAYHRTWIDDPIHAIQKTVVQTLRDRQKITDHQLSQLDVSVLPKFFDRCANFCSDPLILILDQFEELFRYRAQHPDFSSFIDQLTEVMTDGEIPVTVVLSMREDFLAELSVFQDRVPELHGNHFRLQKLVYDQAWEAIVKPVEQAAFGFRYEPPLVDALLADLAHRGREQVERRPAAAQTPGGDAEIEGAYLQIVCQELWKQEQHNPDKTIRKSTYDALGGADAIVKRYFDQIMGRFTLAERRLASRAFGFLVTEWGAKMAYPESVLAKILNVKLKTLQPVLEKLKVARILRDEKRADSTWCELYHDVFARIIDAWSQTYQQRRRRRLNGVLIASIIALLATLGIVSYQANQLAKHRERLALNAGTVAIQNAAGAKVELTCIRHYDPERRCPDQPILAKSATVTLPGPADYMLTASTKTWHVHYPVYIDGITHQTTVVIAPPPASTPHGMAYIPGGIFRLGDKDRRDVQGLLNERPAHDVDISGFYMDVYEVSNADYQQCVQAGSCTPPSTAESGCYHPAGGEIDGGFWRPTRPVVCVDWPQAKTYCEHLGKRLPTEAEWEKAAAGPEGLMWAFGNVFDAAKANTADSGLTATAEVSAYEPNRYGLYNMSGNVSEWVADGYDKSFYSQPEALQPNPVNRQVDAGRRVVRGGAWWHGIEGVRTARRHWEAPGDASTFIGFRCVRPLNSPKSS